MKKKPLRRKILSEKKNEGAQEKKYLPEKYWDGECSRYQICYLDMGDGEQYPIPTPVGELINDLLQDLNRAERRLARGGLEVPARHSTVLPIVVRTFKRALLYIRVLVDD